MPGIVIFFILSNLLPATLTPDSDGRLVTLHGRNFSFQILEPSGWVLDTVGAPQIANFIFHPRDTNWRRAEAVILARFVPRKSDETLSEFVSTNREHFLESCPFGEEDFETDIIKTENEFDIEVYDCPGVRKEIAAISTQPGYYVVLTLSPQSREALDKYVEIFQKVVNSFTWENLSLPDVPLLPPNPEKQSGRIPRK